TPGGGADGQHNHELRAHHGRHVRDDVTGPSRFAAANGLGLGDWCATRYFPRAVGATAGVLVVVGTAEGKKDRGRETSGGDAAKASGVVNKPARRVSKALLTRRAGYFSESLR